MRVPKSVVHEKDPIPAASGVVLNEPTLIWPSIPDTCKNYEYDRNSAPSYCYIKIRHDFIQQAKENAPNFGCSAFGNAIRNSVQILILDTHFNKRSMISLRENIFKGTSTIKELRVITPEKDTREIFDEIKQKLHKASRLAAGMKIGISVMIRNSPPFIHDRFAVTDGELWHFRGIVGGEQKLTAVSRGWSAESHRFINLFSETWSIVQGRRNMR